MKKQTATFALYGGSLESLVSRNYQNSPTVALTIGYVKRNQKKIRRMRRQGLKV